MASAQSSTSSAPNPHAEWNIVDGTRVRLRFKWGIRIVGLAFVILLSRLWFLQVVKGREYLALAQHKPAPAIVKREAAPQTSLISRRRIKRFARKIIYTLWR